MCADVTARGRGQGLLKMDAELLRKETSTHRPDKVAGRALRGTNNKQTAGRVVKFAKVCAVLMNESVGRWMDAGAGSTRYARYQTACTVFFFRS